MQHKNYEIKPDGRMPMYKITNLGSGPVPKPLRGGFTSVAKAVETIDARDRVVSGRIKKRVTKKSNSAG